MKTKALTEKQRQFVVNKVAGCTNREAALHAGYSVNGASQAGDRLMREPAIRKALKDAGKATPPVEVKTATPKMPKASYSDPKAFLLDLMNLADIPIAIRADAAKQLLPYMHARMGETGKKEAKANNARAIARGHGAKGGKPKFATKAPPASNVVPIRNE